MPHLYEKHCLALTKVVKNKPLSIITDETTDVCDHSILNVIRSILGKSYLIGVILMEACNHKTFSHAFIRSVTDIGIEFSQTQVISMTSNSAAYCKKTYKGVLSAEFSNSLHVLCLAHIVNLAAEVFDH